MKLTFDELLARMPGLEIGACADLWSDDQMIGYPEDGVAPECFGYRVVYELVDGKETGREIKIRVLQERDE